MAFLSFDADKHEYRLDGKKLPSITEIVGMLSNFGKVNPAIIRHASRRGTIVHELCELVDYGVETDGIECPPELVNYVMAYMHFLRDYKPDWEMIEQKVFSEDEQIAGTLDRYGYIDGKPWIVDIKTTSSVSRADKVKWAAQLAGYRLMLDPTKEKGVRCMIVHLKKDQKYTVYTVSEIEDKYGFYAETIFQTCLYLYRTVNGGTE